MVTLYLFIILKMDTEDNLHPKMLPVDSFQQSDICNCWVSKTPRCH